MPLSEEGISFVRSLIKTIVSSKKNVQYKFMLKSLCKLPQKEEISNTFVSIFSKCEGEPQEKIIKLYCVYMLANKEIINTIKPSDLYEHFKSIVAGISAPVNFKTAILIYDTLRLIISGLTTFSPFSLYSAVISWSAPVAPLALSALSAVHNDFQGNAVSYLTNRPTNDVWYIAALSSFFSENKFQDLPDAVKEMLTKDFFDSLYEQIHTNFEQNRIAFVTLIGSLFVFVETNESCRICFDFKEEIKNLLSSSVEEERITAAETLCKLPVTEKEDSFNTNSQLEEFSPLFIQSIGDFHTEMAEKLISFFEKRMNTDNIKNCVISLFGKVESFCGLFLICCHFNLFEGNEEIVDLAFPDIISFESAKAVCFATTEMSDKFTVSDDLISKTARVLLYSLHNFYEKLGFYASSGLLSFTNSCKTHKNAYLLSVMNNFPILSTETDFSNVISSVAVLLSEEGPLVPPKVSNDVFIDTAVNCLVKIVSLHGSERNRAIFAIQLLQASIESKEICSDDLTKYKDKHLVDICDDLIPESCIDEIHNRILDLINTEKSANIVAICLNSSIANPAIVMENAQSLDPFDADIFTAFFANAAKRNVTETIDKFTRLIRDTYIPSNSRGFLGMAINILLQKNQQVSPIPIDVAFTTATEIIRNATDLQETHIQALFSTFNLLFAEIPEADIFLRELCKTRKRVNIQSQIVQKIITSPFFIHCFPDLLCMIEKTEDLIHQVVKCWFITLEENASLANETEKFIESCCKDTPQFCKVLIEEVLKVTNFKWSINFTLEVSKYSELPFILKKSVFLWLSPICLSPKEEMRVPAVSSLKNIFRLETDISLSAIPSGQVIINALEFFKVLADKLTLQECDELMTELEKNVSLTSALFINAIVTQKKLDFIKQSKGAMKYILKLGKNESKAVSFYGRKTLQYINEINTVFCLETLFNMKNNRTSYDFAEENANYDFVKTFAVMFKKFNIEDDSSVGLCSFRFIFAFTESIITHETDYILIWLAFFAATSVVVGYNYMTDIGYRNAVKSVSELTKRCFSRIGVVTRELIESDFDSCINIALVFASFVREFNEQQFKELLTPITDVFDLKKIDRQPFILVAGILFANIYKFMTTFNISKEIKDKYQEEVARFCILGKDECCRVLSDYLSRVFVANDIKAMSDKTTYNMQHCVLRSLINPAPELRVNCIKAFCLVVTNECKENIEKEKDKLFQNLTLSFEMSQEVGLDILLDCVAALVEIDSSIRPFVTMSQLSLPRLLILSVNESKSIREKAKRIIQTLTAAESDTELIPALVKAIGVDEVNVIACFFASWAEKNTTTMMILTMIEQFANALTEEKQRTNYITKVTPILGPIIDEVDHPLQKKAIEIFSTLIGE